MSPPRQSRDNTANRARAEGPVDQAQMDTDAHRIDAHAVFEILVRENAAMLTTYLRAAVRDAADVDDLFQEAMIVAWRRLGEFDRCIRCYACRQVCPGCYCSTFMFERDDGLWIDVGFELPQNHMFHLGRALHQAGRCVE